MNKKSLDPHDALLRMADLCSRSEQCAFDITKKLMTKGLSYPQAKEIVDDLTDRGFIDEYRFARSFANDKVRFSAWGKLKIRVHLAAKRISSQAISEALSQIDEHEYLDAAARAAKSKASSLNLSSIDDKRKLYRHLLSRGFDSSIATQSVKNLLTSNR